MTNKLAGKRPRPFKLHPKVRRRIQLLKLKYSIDRLTDDFIIRCNNIKLIIEAMEEK
jgi:hypothetical protein